MIVKNKNNYFKIPILDGLEILDAKNHTLNFPFHTHNTFNITLVLEQIFITKITNHIFKVQRLLADTAIHFKSTIIYQLNTANKIVYIGKE